MPRPRNFRSAPFRERVHVDDREETKGDREKSFSQFAPKRNTWNTGKLRERERKKFVYNEILSRYAIKSMQIRLDCSRDRFVNIQRGVRWIDRAEEAWIASSLRGEERYRVRWGTVHRTAFRVGLAISRDTVRRWRHASFIGGPRCFPAPPNYRCPGRWYYFADIPSIFVPRIFKALGEMSLLRFGPFKDGMCPFWFASNYFPRTQDQSFFPIANSSSSFSLEIKRR